MAFALEPKKSLRRQLIRKVRKQLGRASRLLFARQSGEAVHEARKSVKKAEALVALLDRLGAAAPRKQVRHLRSARRALSVLRDADVLVDTVDAVQSRTRRPIPEHTAALIRKHLTRARSTS